MTVLVAIISALCWGLNPLFIRKIGGKPANEMGGMGIGIAIVAASVLLLFKPTLTLAPLAFAGAVLSGAAWAVGQLGQYMSYRLIGVSKTMPLSTAGQLIGTSLIGVLMFGEWSGAVQKGLGLGAIILIIIGSGLSTGAKKRWEKTVSQSLSSVDYDYCRVLDL